MSRIQDLYYPNTNAYLPEHTSFPMIPNARPTKLQRGEDPKPDFIPYCKMQCNDWGKAYENCERIRKDPKGKQTTCIYMYREWMECVEKCVQPKVLNNLYGGNMRYHFWF